MNKSFSWFLIKLDRIAAWALLLMMVLYLISGYGMTKGIISNSLAINIHNNWLPLILLLSFCWHTCYAISVAFKRWRIWTPILKFLLLGGYFIFFLSFVYVNSFYHKPYKPLNSVGTTTTTKNFTATELSKYDGTAGNPAYVAVDGKVYDVSNLFVGGTHRGCQAGQDVSSAFNQIHDSSFLSSFTVVGSYTG